MDQELQANIAAMQRVRGAIEEIRAGRMVILVDDEDRENEGDLTMAAELVTPEAINFMATYGRGLVCLTLQEEQIERLRLPLQAAPGLSGPTLGTAFTVSIEARYGVTTGISTADRAQTVKVACNPNARPEDLVTPGHVLPLKARKGGVLVRTGQTEGSVDLARLSGLTPAGVICEVMNDDGTMARMPDLEEFGRRHDLLIVTIADLIQYRLQTERFVMKVAERMLVLDETNTEWRAIAYESIVDRQQFLALVKGDISSALEPVLCRVHRGSLLADVFSSPSTEGGRRLRAAFRMIEQAGRGVVLYLPSPADVVAELNATTSAQQRERTLREFGLGAQVLSDIGLKKVAILTNNPRKLAGAAGYGLQVTRRVSLPD